MLTIVCFLSEFQASNSDVKRVPEVVTEDARKLVESLAMTGELLLALL